MYHENGGLSASVDQQTFSHVVDTCPSRIGPIPRAPNLFFFLIRVCLVEWILGRMKKKRKKKERKLFVGCLIGRGREKKKG